MNVLVLHLDHGLDDLTTTGKAIVSIDTQTSQIVVGNIA